MHRIRKGLDLPMLGEPEQRIHDAPPVSHVAVLGDDTPGVRARLAVGEGDRVRRGQLLFEDRARPGVRYTAPSAGRVTAIFRGPRRRLRSVVIQLSESERAGRPLEAELETFASWPGVPEAGRAEDVRALLVESGLWVALRARPFGRVADPAGAPHALFVTAIDTQPHAPDPQIVVAEARADFERGLRLLARLCEAPPIVCVTAGSEFAAGLDAPVRVEEFRGPHPAGSPGVHIHLLDPVSRGKRAWHIGYQDVIAIGKLFTSGHLPVERVVSLGGPLVSKPRLLRTRLGACTTDLISGELQQTRVRVISGSVLAGHRAAGPLAWLGRYHNQISILAAGIEREFLGWMMPGKNKFSSIRAYASHLLHRGTFDMTTSQNGSPRAMVPIGAFERIMPLDILPTSLLKALLVRDTDNARSLGCLELDEEDLALCSFVCNGKYEYGSHLRMNLDEIESSG
ncbi:MAG: Na(+)-translocating NADH-quinone reductase subunit A [Gammaproteobacteria bacterium]|nr:Na(+)-translocating NADH-quinone reductase subunit A [Gammaproteobacteria bacterium]